METRIDFYPTHEANGYKLRPGRVYPLGATVIPGGVNFAVTSRYATGCTLVMFRMNEDVPFAEIPFRPEFRVGSVYAMIVFEVNGLDFERIEYGFRMEGPNDPHNGQRFDKSKILLDPYAKAICGRDVWGAKPDWLDPFPYRGKFPAEDFDWESDRPLELPLENLVIYEMHVRGFTRHESAGVKHGGTYAAIIEKIPYLKSIGINCIELMPIFEFDECEAQLSHPDGTPLCNYWGYNTIGFFAPKAGYAATGRNHMQADELKNLVKQLHAAGIEILLDVVFNHSAEGGENGRYISFRGLDNKTYYMLAPNGSYYNFSGCGNTLNCNNPVVRSLVIDCLNYWVAEYHIDGFRFDLASILGRDTDGTPLANPPLLETLAFEPALSRCKLIAEAWDAGGLYQVGTFPAYGRWAEWNGKYRDCVRRFLKGDEGQVGELAVRLQGSPDLYAALNRGANASINFVTCHDGFPLADLFAYNEKHNEANGENNRDGANDNYSWNCGVEGPTDDVAINKLRRRQMKNALALLIVSRGVPMFLMGDEVGRSQGGNNNTYCHDGPINWLDWSLAEKNADLLRFFREVVAFRHAHRVLRDATHYRGDDRVGSGRQDISFHGVKAWKPDWGTGSRSLAFMLCGQHASGGAEPDNDLFVIMNMYWEPLVFELPPVPTRTWHLFVDTFREGNDDVAKVGEEPVFENQKEVKAGPRSVVIFISK